MRFSRIYICTLMLILATLIACGGGGGGGGSNDNPPPANNEIFGTGDQDFVLETSELTDPLNGYRVSEGDSNTLPTRVDHSNRMPRVRSQGRTSSCTSWAVGYYGKSFQEALEEGWDPDQNAFSPAYLYAMQCRNYNQPWAIYNAWETLNRHGIAKWGSLPFEDLSEGGNRLAEKANYADLTISQRAHEEAKIYRCGENARMQNLADLKNALTQGPVVLSINWYNSPPRNTSPEDNYMRHNPDNTDAGHAILCVGYDNSKFGVGALKFVNSWGTGWGENGYSWIRYTDIPNIVRYALNYKDIPNPNTPDDPDDIRTKPDPPTDVAASDNAGSYVDITWSQVPGAQYYRISRSRVDDHTTFAEIGIAYRGYYRDHPEPGVAYYYSVVGVNDLGASQNFASDTDAAGHVDIGSAIGDVLMTPQIQWHSNDDDGSHFTVSSIDPDATSMEVLVSTSSEGPWNSLGWINPGDFTINWGEDSEYTHQRPYVRVRVANVNASSELSDAARVGQDIINDVDVARISIFVMDDQSDRIQVRWMTDGGNADFFEVWRYCASNDAANDWVKLGYTPLDQIDGNNFYYFDDQNLLPGVPYYYAVAAVYQGTYGEWQVSSNPMKIDVAGINLNLASYEYYHGEISRNTQFRNVVIRNDGGAPVDGYCLGVLAYSWSDQQIHAVHRFDYHTRLEAGDQHRFHTEEFLIPDEYADGSQYSWGLWVDCNDTYDELYEDDNLKWSAEAWRVIQNSASAEFGQIQYPLLGSSRPFTRSNEILSDFQPDSDEVEQASNAGSFNLIYNGPATFHRPERSNPHTR